jgi:(p)ppGpp synthase/HD superfamily hydrolase
MRYSLGRFSDADGRRIAEARQFAAAAHRGQLRKVSGQPYIVHPAGVAAHLAAAGFGADVVIGGMLHDALEDGAATRADLESRFGAIVASLVVGVTNGDCRGSWRERKRRALRRLAGVSADCLAVKCADALDNLDSIRRDLDRYGDLVWHRLRPKAQMRWYFESLSRLFGARLREGRGKLLAARFRSQFRAVFGE